MTSGSTAQRSGRVAGALVALGLLLFGAGAALVPLRSSEPLPAHAAAGVFSAGRALEDVEQVAAVPRPVGSPAHAEVRDRLRAELDRSGLVTSIATSASCRRSEDGLSCAQVGNIRGSLRGTRPGRIVLVAHYDSSPSTPGASDNAVALSILLEVSRILAAGWGDGAGRNSVDVLFTDGEELGLLGAGADVRAHPPDPLTVVVNLDARGTRGTPVLYQTGQDSSVVLRALDGWHIYATSAGELIASFLPNETDFTLYGEAGARGADIAFVGGSARYETPQDDLAAVSPETVQTLGTGMLHTADRLSRADLEAPSVDNVSYWSVAGWVVVLPEVLLPGLAGAAVLVVVVGSVLEVRQRQANLVQGGLDLVAVVATMALAGGLSWALAGLVLVREPAWLGLVYGEPYEPARLHLGFALLTVAAAGLSVGLGSRWRVRWAAGALVVCALAAGLLTVVAPAAAYVFVVPALVGGVARIVMVVRAGRVEKASERPPDRVLPVALGIPLLVTSLPLTVLLYPALGLSLAAVPTALLALILAGTLGDLVGGRGPGLVRRPIGLAVAAVTASLLVALLPHPGPSADEPHLVSITFVADHDRRTGQWLTPFPPGNRWVDGHVGPGIVAPAVPTLYSPGYRTGPAPYRDLPRPALAAVAQRPIGDRSRITAALTTRAGQQALLCLSAADAPRVQDLAISGVAIGRWDWPESGPFRCITLAGFSRAAPVVITLRDQQPIELVLVGRLPGLPSGPGFEPMPAHIDAAAGNAIASLGIQRIETRLP